MVNFLLFVAAAIIFSGSDTLACVAGAKGWKWYAMCVIAAAAGYGVFVVASRGGLVTVNVTLLNGLIVLFATVIGAVLFQERLLPPQWLGVVLVLTGICILAFYPSGPPPAPTI